MVVDCLNLPCPEPVIKTKKALEGLKEDGIIEVYVNEKAAKENVIRFANSMDCDVKVSDEADKTILTITKGFTCNVTTSSDSLSNKVVFLKDDKIGVSGLGEKLIVGFLKSMVELPKPPKEIICVNRAVYLTTQNSDTIEALKGLEKRGVAIYSCGVCLDFYGLSEELKVGVVGNAYATVEMLTSREGVVTF